MGHGLNICRSIIESHHGRLWATANSGRGTVSASPPLNPDDRTRVYIVDDDSDCAIRSMLLESRGLKVELYLFRGRFLHAYQQTASAAAWCSMCACRE